MAPMSGAILQRPTRSDADWESFTLTYQDGLPMCGHGTIGVATVLVEKKLVNVVEPITTIRLDTPAGLVVVDVQVKEGKAESVTIINVPSFSYELDQSVEVPGFGRITYDMAFGGNFYAVLHLVRLALNLNVRMARKYWMLVSDFCGNK